MIERTMSEKEWSRSQLMERRKPSPGARDPKEKKKILKRYQTQYRDFGPTFACEQLKAEINRESQTQMARALENLDIRLICANSPQAKGRVERANGTLQDRLVKELRLRKISTLEKANAYLPVFVESYNQKLAVVPEKAMNVFRSLNQTHAELARILNFQEMRTVSKNLELSYQNISTNFKSHYPATDFEEPK